MSVSQRWSLGDMLAVQLSGEALAAVGCTLKTGDLDLAWAEWSARRNMALHPTQPSWPATATKPRPCNLSKVPMPAPGPGTAQHQLQTHIASF